MKNTILTTLFLLSVVMISCQKEAITNSSNVVKVTVRDASDKSLKTAFINPSVKWLGGIDEIGFFSDRAYTTAPGVFATNVDYTAQSTGTISTFSSSTPVYWDGTANVHDFGAYYPYAPGALDYTAIPISLPALQAQVGSSTTHIGALDFEVATPIGLTPVPGANPSVDFTFNHVFTILKFDLTCVNTNTLASISLTSSSGPNISLNTGSTIDISQYPTPAAGVPYAISSAGGTQTVTLYANLLVSSTVASAYMLILPGDQSSNIFTIVFTSSSAKTFTVTKPGKVFGRGNVYTVTQDIPVGGANGW